MKDRITTMSFYPVALIFTCMILLMVFRSIVKVFTCRIIMVSSKVFIILSPIQLLKMNPIRKTLIAANHAHTHSALKIILVTEYINAHAQLAGDEAAFLGKVVDKHWNAGIDTAVTEFINTVNRLLPGKKYCPAPIENLSDREFEIAGMLASGMSLTKVSEKLSLGLTKTRIYRNRIMEKLHLKTSTGLTLFAIKHKML